MLHLGGTRPVIASEAKQSGGRRGLTFPWIASSLTLLAMMRWTAPPERHQVPKGGRWRATNEEAVHG